MKVLKTRKRRVITMDIGPFDAKETLLHSRDGRVHHIRHRLKQVMASRGGYVLHLDGACGKDSPHLFTGMDGVAQIVLDNIKLPSEKTERLIPFFQKIKRQYGDPVALVHDMGRGILPAKLTKLLKGNIDANRHLPS